MQFIINSHGGIVSVEHDVDDCDAIINNARIPNDDKTLIRNTNLNEQYIHGRFDNYTLQHFMTDDINLFITQWIKKKHKLTMEMISTPLEIRHEVNRNDMTTLVNEIRDAVKSNKGAMINDCPVFLSNADNARTVFDNLLQMLPLMNTKTDRAGRRIADDDKQIVTLSVYAN